ncbi:MAG: DoxX family protein [Flavobacteriales bacterium]|nr:DoxX family protein [Flavobacteriales bacterium]
MTKLNNIARTLVGALFIVSGLIKANDAVGFSFKLGEYFAPDVLDIPFLSEYTYSLAVIICIAEIMLGLSVLVGAKMRLTAWSLLLMILFFDGLTFYSAYFDKVTDCGCFGDAIKLTPWESFAKDVALSILIFIIFTYRNKVKYQTRAENSKILPVALLLVGLFSYFMLGWLFPIYFTIVLFLLVRLVNKFILKEKREWALALLTLVTCFAFTYHTDSHLPIRDFRAYAVGENIAEGMTLPEGAQADVYDDVWKYEVDGIVNEYATKDKPWEIDGAVFVDRETKLIVEGDHPPIHDFSIESDTLGDVTDSVLAASDAILFVMYDLTESDREALRKVAEIVNALSDEAVTMTAMSATTETQMELIQKEADISFPFYFTDETTLKTIVRSNPGMLWLKEGTIVAKWHYNDFPASEDLIKQYLR